MSSPEIKGEIHYHKIAFYDNATQQYSVVATDVAIPGGIASIVASFYIGIDIIDNANNTSPVTTSWNIASHGTIFQVNSTTRGDTFAEAHPDKLDIWCYDFVIRDGMKEIAKIPVSIANLIYTTVIDYGNIKRVENEPEGLDGIESIYFTVRSLRGNIRSLAGIRVYENGFVKCYTGFSIENEDYYELYYNPKGYDLNRLFATSHLTGETLTDRYPEVFDGMIGITKVTLTKIYGSGVGANEEYTGFLAETIYKAVIISADQIKQNLNGVNGDYYAFTITVNGHTFLVRAYDDVLAMLSYDKKESGEWEYYHNPYLAEHVSHTFEQLKTFVHEQVSPFEIDGKEIAYKVDFDTNHAFALTQGREENWYWYCDVYYTSDGGNTWTKIYSDLAVDGYIECLKAVNKETLMYVFPNYDDDGPFDCKYLNINGSILGYRPTESLPSLLQGYIYQKNAGDAKDYLSETMQKTFSDFVKGETDISSPAGNALNLISLYSSELYHCITYKVEYNNGIWNVFFAFSPLEYPWISFKAGISLEFSETNGYFVITDVFIIN